jgi:hypothetical protein
LVELNPVDSEPTLLLVVLSPVESDTTPVDRVLKHVLMVTESPAPPLYCPPGL